MTTPVYLGHTGTELDADLEKLIGGLPDGETIVTSLKQYLGNTNNVINIANEGAKTDGSSDDSAAVTRAMTKAIANNRGIIEFPPGMTMMAAGVKAHRNFTFRGVGVPAGGISSFTSMHSTILHDTNDDAFLFDGAEDGAYTSGGGVERLRIVQVKTGSNAGCGIRMLGTATTRPAWWKIRNCIIEESGGPGWKYAIEVDGHLYSGFVPDWWISDVSAHCTGLGGLRLNKAAGGKIIGSAFYDVAGSAIIGDVDATTQIHFTNTDCAAGVSMTLDRVTGDFSVMGGTFTSIVDTVNTQGPIVLLPGYLQVPFISNSVGGQAIGCWRYDELMIDGFHNGAWVPNRPIALMNNQNFSVQLAAGGAAHACIGVDTSDRVRIGRNGDAVVALGQVSDTSDLNNGDVVIGGSGAGIPRFRIGPKAFITFGDGSPENNVAAGLGSFYGDTLNGRLYIKQSGTGNTGWVVK